jgi:DNA-binding SARP family transcriptional activator
VTTVQTYIYHLRRLFAGGGLGTEDEPLITTRPAGYVIAAAPGEVDAAVFEELLSRGRDSLEAGSVPEASELLGRALDLWTGPALADVPLGSHLRAHGVHLDELRINAVELRIQADLKLGRHRSLIAELRSLTQEHPLNEWFHGQLISALTRSGRRGEALAAYQDVRHVLADELGVDPSPALQNLQRQVLTAGAA